MRNGKRQLVLHNSTPPDSALAIRHGSPDPNRNTHPLTAITSNASAIPLPPSSTGPSSRSSTHAHRVHPQPSSDQPIPLVSDLRLDRRPPITETSSRRRNNAAFFRALPARRRTAGRGGAPGPLGQHETHSTLVVLGGGCC